MATTDRSRRDPSSRAYRVPLTCACVSARMSSCGLGGDADTPIRAEALTYAAPAASLVAQAAQVPL